MSISVLCPSSRSQGVNEEVYEDDKDQPVCGVVVAKNWNKQITMNYRNRTNKSSLFTKIHANDGKFDLEQLRFS